MIEHLPAQACIVGAGAAGGLIARRLVDAGLLVVLLKAGPWYADPRHDFVEDELAMRKLIWPETEYAITGTASRGRLNAGFGVGGGSLVWTGPRPCGSTSDRPLRPIVCPKPASLHQVRS